MLVILSLLTKAFSLGSYAAGGYVKYNDGTPITNATLKLEIYFDSDVNPDPKCTGMNSYIYNGNYATTTSTGGYTISVPWPYSCTPTYYRLIISVIPDRPTYAVSPSSYSGSIDKLPGSKDFTGKPIPPDILSVVKYNQTDCTNCNQSDIYNSTCGPTSAKMIIHYLKVGANAYYSSDAPNSNWKGVSKIDKNGQYRDESNSSYNKVPSYASLYSMVVEGSDGLTTKPQQATMVNNTEDCTTILNSWNGYSLTYKGEYTNNSTFSVSEILTNIRTYKIPVIVTINASENGGEPNHAVIVVGVQRNNQSGVHGIYQVNTWKLSLWDSGTAGDLDNYSIGNLDFSKGNFPYAYYDLTSWVDKAFVSSYGIARAVKK